MSSSWIGVWFTAVARPSISNFENLISNAQANAKAGYIWVVITGAIAAVISFLLLGPHQQAIISLLCGIPFLGVGSLLAVVIIAGSTHGIARLLGGTGSYSKMVYLVSAFSAPMTILSSILFFLPFSKWLNGILTIYWVVLTIIAVRAVYKLPLGKSVISSLVLIILALIAIVAVFMLPTPA